MSFLDLDREARGVLMICGDEDGCVCSDMYERGWGEEGGGVTVRKIEGAGHWMHLEKAGVVEKYIEEHLGKDE